MLLSVSVLEELERLGERSGRSFFEQRIRELQATFAAQDSGAASRSAEIERKLDEIRLRPFEADQHELTFDRLKNQLSAKGARAWLAWAEDRELLVRGARVECGRCGATRWRPAADLVPPVICPGCARVVPRPFRADALPFRYRASEMLLQVLSLRAMPHILAARWLSRLFERGLYGLHPGVDVYDDDDRRIGEVDLALVFAGGGLALGECKLTARGLTAEEVEKHETLADLLDADWTFYAVPAWAAECSPLWEALQREMPQRPRWALAHEQLLAPDADVFWTVGTNPLAWAPADEDTRRRRHEEFVAAVPRGAQHLEDEPHLDQMLLHED